MLLTLLLTGLALTLLLVVWQMTNLTIDLLCALWRQGVQPSAEDGGEPVRGEVL